METVDFEVPAIYVQAMVERLTELGYDVSMPLGGRGTTRAGEPLIRVENLGSDQADNLRAVVSEHFPNARPL